MANTITLLTVDGRYNSLSVSTRTPVFKWTSSLDGLTAVSGYEIRVGTSDANIGTNSFSGNTWSPGQVQTPVAFESGYNFDGSGTSLVSNTKYYFQVRLLGDTPSDWATGYFKLNAAPQSTSAVVVPSTVFANDEMEASYNFVDSSNSVESNKTVIKWYRKKSGSSTFEKVLDQRTVPKKTVQPGEQWKFTVKVSDGLSFSSTVESNTITVLNRAPTASALAVLPSLPTTADSLQAYFILGDPDNSDVNATIRWYKDGIEQPAFKNASLVPPSSTTAGEKWYFTVLPNDGTDNGPLAISESVVIQNSPPRILSMSINSASPLLPVKSQTPTFSWTYMDDDEQVQQKYRLVIGTKPLRTAVQSSLLGKSTLVSPNYTQFGQTDGIFAVVKDGTVVDGKEVFDSGTVSSDANYFTYFGPGSISAFSMGATYLGTLKDYEILSDAQTLSLKAGKPSGSASGKFNGQSAVYNITLKYIKENDKRSTYKLIVDGNVIGQFASQPGTGLGKHVFNSVTIRSGSVVGVLGVAADNGAFAKFQSLVFEPVTVLEVNADAFTTLSGYLKDGNGGIKLAGVAGTATLKFPFPTGTYDIELIYVTENGTPGMTVSKNGTQIDTFTYEANSGTRSRFISGQEIAYGDSIKLSGTRNGGSLARVKKVIFRPTTLASAGSVLEDGTTYYISVKVHDGDVWSDWYVTKFSMAGTAWQSVSNATGWTIEARLSVQ